MRALLICSALVLTLVARSASAQAMSGAASGAISPIQRVSNPNMVNGTSVLHLAERPKRAEGPSLWRHVVVGSAVGAGASVALLAILSDEYGRITAPVFISGVVGGGIIVGGVIGLTVYALRR